MPVRSHKVSWDEARILEIESNRRYRKYRESANPVRTFLLFGSPLQAIR
jgi:hypothetical protein